MFTLLSIRDLYSGPPPARTPRQNNPTLLVSWWCTGFSLSLILARICGRFIRTERLFREDKIMAWGIIPLLARMALVHVILMYGTNNATNSDDMSDAEIQRREIGSKLVLASRILFALFLWTTKLTVSEFLRRLTSQFWRRSYQVCLQAIRAVLVLSFCAIVATTLSECRPFDHYWQVKPEPGPQCREGVIQLFTMTSCDALTDILLVCFPVSIIIRSSMPLKRKFSLVLLFALSLTPCAVSIYRAFGVMNRDSLQQFRTLLASVEILAAAAATNALVLGSFVRDRGAKKQRWRLGSAAEHGSPCKGQTPRRAITQRDWGSDADLVSDLGICCAPELSETKSPALLNFPPQATTRKSENKSRNHSRNPSSRCISGLGLQLRQPPKDRFERWTLRPYSHAPLQRNHSGPFDVGGLLAQDSEPSTVHERQLRPASPARNFSRPASPMPPTNQPSNIIRPDNFF